jgi:hypothetical protein
MHQQHPKTRIKNWSAFQHFKDRRPPWIKLHRTILEQRDINAISDRTFRILVGLWLLASEDESMTGTVPCIEDVAFRLRVTTSDVTTAYAELGSLLVHDDIGAISKRYQSDIPETETEKKTETYPPTPKGAEGVYALSNAPSNAPSMVPDRKGETSGTSPGHVRDFSVSVSSSVSEGDSEGEAPTKPKRARKKKEPEEYTDDFCRFWDAYPRKANKRYAWESWQGALDRPPLDRILLAVDMQSRQDSWRKDGGHYIPHPSTWINRGGWDDVPLQSRVAHSLAGG